MQRIGPEPEVDLGWRNGRPRLVLREAWVCRTCGEEYRPVVRSGSRTGLAVAVLVVVAGVALFGAFFLIRLEDQLSRGLGVGLLPLLALLALFAPWIVRKLGQGKTEPTRWRVHRADEPDEPRGGQIVLECPSCGASDALPPG